jgi:hypothetical protein
MNELTKFIESVDVWDLYNGFFLHKDVERLRKFLVREHLLKMTLDVPGDIVEVGCLKGTGIAQLLKLREIFIPASNKKVVGFDLFLGSKSFSNTLKGHNNALSSYYDEAGVNIAEGISRDHVMALLNKMRLTNAREGQGPETNIYELIEGDVTNSIPEYVSKNPGFRISFLYLDLDIDEPTAVSLKFLYDKVVRGGVIVFDEYACAEWTESNAVDAFLAEHPNLVLKTLPWARTPTAYIVKP